jgi:hypothetical protein
VRIHKTVKVEERHFTITDHAREVVIEHLAAAGRYPAPATSAFQEQIVDVPVHEEELRVTGIRPAGGDGGPAPSRTRWRREASATLRREEVEVEDTRPTSARGTTATTEDSAPRAPGVKPLSWRRAARAKLAPSSTNPLATLAPASQPIYTPIGHVLFCYVAGAGVI